MKEKAERIRLLLVDDEMEFLTATTKALKRRGFDVTPARYGETALKILESESFDVAVLDVKMPGMDGDELFREMKQRWPRIPVVMLTGHGTVEQAFQTSQEGVFDYLSKPCDIEKLVRVAGKAMAAYRQAGTSGRLQPIDEKIRLLIVDDEKELTESLSAALTRRGMRVTTADDGAMALKTIGKQLFDVVLLDVKMPKIDGVTLLFLIKQAQPLCEVILFTGQPSINTVVEGVKRGAFDFLVKPQDPEALVARILAAYKSSRSRAAAAERKEIDGLLETHKY